MLPDFDWTEEEREEMAEALVATDAWQRFVEEGSETQGAWRWDRWWTDSRGYPVGQHGAPGGGCEEAGGCVK